MTVLTLFDHHQRMINDRHELSASLYAIHHGGNHHAGTLIACAEKLILKKALRSRT